MANPATANEPSAEDVQAAVDAIEKLDADLLALKAIYMNNCKTVRQNKTVQYDHASDQGISRKVLKALVKERALERRIDDMTSYFEDEERSECEMISQKLREFKALTMGQSQMVRAA
jgi:hypothetical protein